MGFLNMLKGVFRNMFKKEDIVNQLHVVPLISEKMRKSIERWSLMYKDESPWVMNDPNIYSLGLPSLIASEKARMATLEMEVKITGENERADFMRESFKQVQKDIRKQLEYGIALGGIIIKPYVVMGVNNKYKIKFNYVKADKFYPLAFSDDGKITSCAFIDRIVTKDKVYSKFEVHTLMGNTVKVNNYAYAADYMPNTNVYGVNTLGNPVALSTIDEWSNLQPETIIENVDTLLFAYFKNPEANTIDMESPLGISGFARAEKLIQDADRQYSNLLWEFEGGQLAIDVDTTALNPIKDRTGKEIQALPKLQDRLYRRTLDLGADDMYNVFSPQLRDGSILNGLNDILMHIEDVTSLARGTISNVQISEARTATELKILKQRAYSANKDVQDELETTFESLFNIMDIYCNLYRITPDGSFEVAYKWDDSILVDKDSERQNDMLEVDKGLMSKVEYRMKWHGETETQAEEMMKKITEETTAYTNSDEQTNATTEDDITLDNEKEVAQYQKEQANASGEIKK